MAPAELIKDCVTTEKAAEMLGWSVKYLRNRMSLGLAPDNFKYGKRAYFRTKDVEAFRRSMIQVRKYR